MSDPAEKQNSISIPAAIEALLFVSPGPVTTGQLAEALEIESGKVEQGLKELAERQLAGGGLRIQWHGGRVQLTTAPEYGAVIEQFLGLEVTTRLSRAALETLAIVAYRQPITRPGIDAVRGVNSDGVLKSLLSKGLVQEVGRTDGPGRPILFGTTADFLQHFGFASLEDLPMFEILEPEINAADGSVITNQAANGSGRLLKD